MSDEEARQLKRQKEIGKLLSSSRHGESLTDILARQYQAEFNRKAAKAWHDLWHYGEHPTGQLSLTPQIRYRVEAFKNSKWVTVDQGLRMEDAVVRRTAAAEGFGRSRIINEQTGEEVWGETLG